MSPNEREAMRIRLSQITQSTPELKKEIESLASRFPELQRSDLSQFWLAASEQERESIRTSLASMEKTAQSDLMKTKVDAFIKKRDAAFDNMRAALEKKRQSLTEQDSPDP